MKLKFMEPLLYWSNTKPYTAEFLNENLPSGRKMKGARGSDTN